MSTALRYFLPSGGAPLIEVLASARPRTSWRPGTIIGRRSVVEVVAEAASRGGRYDKYFAVGKFSRHKFNRRLLVFMRDENNFASLQLFSCISPRNSVLVFRNKFSETITYRRILSGGCELSHGFAVIDLSLEHPVRAQGFLDPVCTEIARPICV